MTPHRAAHAVAWISGKFRLSARHSALLASLVLCGPACAHPSPDASGQASAMAGLLHPMAGLDHALAMATVGLLGAAIGGCARWTVPASFLTGMALGALAGVLGLVMPFADLAILLSVVALGLALALVRRMPQAAVYMAVGLFALFHGAAHALEAPTHGLSAWLVGVLAGTALLHGLGAAGAVALLRFTPRAETKLRGLGVVIAASGVVLAVG
ncbi:HupE/UreJ family protein [Alsobacter sp. SYSU M60028]|uniref:HupE/UreJ family protein n=1 Tax=Alsobacter ponti TaxID=2962936 RepID=A0ABT1LEI7_9HYPH|nr:HupE/UreJ family protein [Alsobacter ponti]MCP8939907.1 HupE/UreJ family protein [Alsobacter ponti]